MAKYRYTAVDVLARPVSGCVDAPTVEQALQQLASQGLRATAADLTEVPESTGEGESPVGEKGDSPHLGGQMGTVPFFPAAAPGRLSANETAEFGARVGGLAGSGLPLGPGLRAMAAELPPGRLAAVLAEMADRLDAGATLDAAIQAQGSRLPGHVRGLLLAGLRSGRLGEAMQQFAAIQHKRLELVRRVKAALAYPLILGSLLLVLLVILSVAIVPQFKSIFGDFGTALPQLTRLVIEVVNPREVPLLIAVALLAVALWVSAIAPGPAWLRRLFHWFPILGPMWYWTRMAEFARLMQLLLRQQTPLPSALALTAAGMEDPSLAAGCARVAADVEAGSPLSESLSRRSPFPASLAPVTRWGERTQSLGEAFGAAVELFERHALVYASLLENVLPPVAFLVILILVGFVILALFMPLIALISNLSGGF